MHELVAALTDRLFRSRLVIEGKKTFSSIFDVVALQATPHTVAYMRHKVSYAAKRSKAV